MSYTTNRALRGPDGSTYMDLADKIMRYEQDDID
jgi:hypothetical protein